jgi:cell surface protein SprA
MKTMSLLIVLRFGIAIGILEVQTSTCKLVINYEIPINKIPLFSFVKANYSYTGDYNWQKSSNAFSQLDIGIPDLGNTVQNARSNNLNTSFNMDMLYKYLG